MVLSFIFAAATDGSDAGKAIAVGVGGGLGAVGAGVGIGIIFGKVIESVTRQPEMRDEITSIQWLGFALTEACFFYGLVAGLLPLFLLEPIVSLPLTVAPPGRGRLPLSPHLRLMIWTPLGFGISMLVPPQLPVPPS